MGPKLDGRDADVLPLLLLLTAPVELVRGGMAVGDCKDSGGMIRCDNAQWELRVGCTRRDETRQDDLQLQQRNTMNNNMKERQDDADGACDTAVEMQLATGGGLWRMTAD